MSTSIQYSFSVPVIEYFKLFLFILVIKMLNSEFNISKLMSFISMIMKKPRSSMVKQTMLMEQPKPNIFQLFNTLIPVVSELLSDVPSASNKAIPINGTPELKKIVENITE